MISSAVFAGNYNARARNANPPAVLPDNRPRVPAQARTRYPKIRSKEVIHNPHHSSHQRTAISREPKSRPLMGHVDFFICVSLENEKSSVEMANELLLMVSPEEIKQFTSEDLIDIKLEAFLQNAYTLYNNALIISKDTEVFAERQQIINDALSRIEDAYQELSWWRESNDHLVFILEQALDKTFQILTDAQF